MKWFLVKHRMSYLLSCTLSDLKKKVDIKKTGGWRKLHDEDFHNLHS
jgi:hypothetical protein